MNIRIFKFITVLAAVSALATAPAYAATAISQPKAAVLNSGLGVINTDTFASSDLLSGAGGVSQSNQQSYSGSFNGSDNSSGSQVNNPSMKDDSSLISDGAAGRQYLALGAAAVSPPGKVGQALPLNSGSGANTTQSAVVGGNYSIGASYSNIGNVSSASAGNVISGNQNLVGGAMPVVVNANSVSGRPTPIGGK